MFPAYIEGLIGQTAENVEALNRNVQSIELQRMAFVENLTTLSERLGRLSDQMRTEQNLLVRLAEGQITLQNSLDTFVRSLSEGSLGVDDATKASLRNLERIGNALLEGREHTTDEIRSEIRILSRTLAAASQQEFNQIRSL
jgi:hypothetical protein